MIPLDNMKHIQTKVIPPQATALSFQESGIKDGRTTRTYWTIPFMRKQPMNMLRLVYIGHIKIQETSFPASLYENSKLIIQKSTTFYITIYIVIIKQAC